MVTAFLFFAYLIPGPSCPFAVPRHVRQCNTVAWNPTESNLIAAGLEKHRTDHSVLLWDLQRCPHSNGKHLVS